MSIVHAILTVSLVTNYHLSRWEEGKIETMRHTSPSPSKTKSLKADILSDLLTTSFKFVDVAKKMVQSCRLKKNKKRTYSRYIISFFFKRAIEMFESFIILIQEQKLADSAMLLRSFIEMGINVGFIFENKFKKEMNALRYILNASKAQKKILKKNIDNFKEINIDVESRLEIIEREIKEDKKKFKDKFPDHDTELPCIEQRADDSGSEVLKKAYNQLYRYFSNIEHHNTWFGRDYVDEEECSPVEEIRREYAFAPEVNLWTFRSIFVVIMKTFNEEFSLKWEKKIQELKCLHEAEYEQMKKERIEPKEKNDKLG